MSNLRIQLDASVLEVFNGGLVVRYTGGCSDHSPLTGLGVRSILSLAADGGATDESLDSLSDELQHVPGNWQVEMSGLQHPKEALITGLLVGFSSVYANIAVHTDTYHLQASFAAPTGQVKCLLVPQGNTSTLHFDGADSAAIAVGVMHHIDESGEIHLVDNIHGYRELSGPFKVSKIDTARALLNVLGVDFEQRKECERMGLARFCPFKAGSLKNFVPLIDF
jgi:hypothetical protein